jgi:hypothetical protein
MLASSDPMDGSVLDKTENGDTCPKECLSRKKNMAGGATKTGNEHPGDAHNNPGYCGGCSDATFESVEEARERIFLQAERLLRQAFYSVKDHKKANSMRKRIEEVLKKNQGHASSVCGPDKCVATQQGIQDTLQNDDVSEMLFNPKYMEELRGEVKDMFQFAFDKYMAHAYPYDELKPLACEGKNVFGPHGYRLTLIDALDTFVVVGNIKGFSEAVKRVIKEVSFDIDVSMHACAVFPMNFCCFVERYAGSLLFFEVTWTHERACM